MSRAFSLSLISAAIFLTSAAYAQTAAPQNAKAETAKAATSKSSFTDAQINALIDQLSASGKLDKAIDAGIKRYVEEQRNNEAKQREAMAKQSADNAKLARKVSPARDHIFGNPNAEWSYIVYSDLECPYCKQHAGVPEAMAKAIGVDTINVVFRHFPLPFHGDNAKKEAVASECVAKQAGNDGFYKFVNLVLNRSQLNGQGLKGGDAELTSVAKEAGAKDETAFASCMQDVKMQEPVKEDMADGVKAGVNGTPGNIIRNNKTGLSVAAHGSAPGGVATVEASVRAAMKAPAKPQATK